MLTPTSSPVPPREGAPVSGPETAVDGIQDPTGGVDPSHLVFEVIPQAVTLPVVDPIAHDTAGAAQIMPGSPGSEIEAAPPAHPWPVMDSDSGPRTQPAPSAVGDRHDVIARAESPGASTGAVADATINYQGSSRGPGLLVEAIPDTRSEPASSPPAKATEHGTLPVDHKPTLPAGGELQRVELALQGSRPSGVDARILLAPPTAPAMAGEPAGHASVQGGSASATPSMPPVLGNSASLMASMVTLASGSGGVARLRLDPPLLGEVTVQLTVHATGVDCSLRTGSSIGAEALVRELTSLRLGLESRGLVVDRLVVHGPQGLHEVPVDQEEPADARRQAEDDRNQERRHPRRPVPVAGHEDESWLFQDMLALDAGSDQATTKGEQVS